MTYEEAANIAKERAKMGLWAEEHIANPRNEKCNCSLCYWRRVHIEKILREANNKHQ